MNIKNIFSVLIAFFMLSTIASAIEIRGTVVTGSGTYTWTAQNFAGFQYDIDSDILTSETMTTIVTDRNIATDNLVYSTTKQLISKPKHEDYYVVGWMGEKYVAVGGKTNKIAKLVFEMNDEEKLTSSQGSTLTLGGGYSLKVLEVDAKSSPRQAWFQLLKDGNVIDDAIVSDKQNYTYKTTVLGDSDTPIFRIYIDSIFSGSEVSMIQMKYGWLIDANSAKEVKTGDTYGSMKVETSNSDTIILKNKNAISLSKNSEVVIMGNMKFRIANSDTLRFYPKIDVISDKISIISPTLTSTPIPSPIPTKVDCTPVEKIIYKDVIVTVTVTPEPTPEPTIIVTPKPSSGFSVLFAIAGLLAVAYIVLRQRK